MKIGIGITVSCVAVLMLGACGNSQSMNNDNLETVKITLERTECYGFCPVYTLTILGDGTVIYDGKDHVQTLGMIEITIDEAKIEKLVEKFEALDYFSFNNEYTERTITDAPTVTTSITLDGKTKTVKHYHGDFNAPEELGQLEDYIDEIVNSSQWIDE
ncbi:DUF6438 domain-containing protein [Chloroflexota bacterium]